MAGSAENVEALAAALKNYLRDRERHHVAGIVADLAGIEIGVCAQVTAGYRAFDRRTGGALVGEEVAARKGILARLDVHVEAAGGGESDRGQQGHDGEKSLAQAAPIPTLAQRTRKSGAPPPGHDGQAVELRSTGQPRAAVPT